MRWRATARTLLACLFAALLITSLYIPHGHWMVMTILVVHQPNAGASVRKAFERVLGTIAGSVSAIVTIMAFAQQPWFALPAVGLLSATGLFVSRTSVIPYAALLAAITNSLFMSVGTIAPDQTVHQGLWRMLLISLGAIIGTGAHLLLWPIDPERELEQSLARTLDQVAGALRRLLAGRIDPVADRTLLAAATTMLPSELALLQASEARHPSLRRRHVEQLALLSAGSRLATAAAALATEGIRDLDEGADDAPLRCRIERLAALTEGHAQTLRNGETPPAQPAAPADAIAAGLLRIARVLPSGTSLQPEGGVPAHLARLYAHVVEMERALALLPVALAFARHPTDEAAPLPLRSPLDEVPEPRLFTPAFTLSNTTDLVYAMKGGLAAMAAQVAAEGVGMANPATATVTAVIVAQGTVGASLQKALLRAAGAVVGGLFAILAMVFVFPSIASLPSFLVVAAVGFGVAAYVTAGSPRIAYVGIQIGMAFAMAVLDTFGPATDLAIPRDRVLGILLGVGVFTAIDLAFAPTYAGPESVRRITAALRHMAELARCGRGEGATLQRTVARSAAIRPLSAYRRQVVEDLSAALQREDEVPFEPGAGSERALAASRLRRAVLYRVQVAFPLVLAVVRDRLNLALEQIPLERRRAAAAFADAIPPTLEAIAARMEGRRAAAPALEPLLAALRREVESSANDPALLGMVAQSQFYLEIGPMLAELARAAEDYAGSLSSWSRVAPS